MIKGNFSLSYLLNNLDIHIIHTFQEYELVTNSDIK